MRSSQFDSRPLVYYLVTVFVYTRSANYYSLHFHSAIFQHCALFWKPIFVDFFTTIAAPLPRLYIYRSARLNAKLVAVKKLFKFSIDVYWLKEKKQANYVSIPQMYKNKITFPYAYQYLYINVIDIRYRQKNSEKVR